MPAVDTRISTTVRELFETVLPDGSASPAFIDARGRQVVMPGRIDPRHFADEANALIAMSTAAGLLDEGAPLHGRVLTPGHAMVRPARPEIELETGSLVLDWNVEADDPSVIDVTLAEG